MNSVEKFYTIAENVEVLNGNLVMKVPKSADEFAIEFAEWCENKNVFSPSVIHKPPYNKLLMQFKKEKGL